MDVTECTKHRAPAEVLGFIFEELADKKSTPSSLTLVSHPFRDIVTPIKYRHIILTERLLVCATEVSLQKGGKDIGTVVWEKVCIFTQYVEVLGSFDLIFISRLLLAMQDLKELK